MTRSRTGPLLCPNCKKLISTYVEQCPYCGLSRPGARWKQLRFPDADNGAALIKILIGTNVVMYLICLLFNPARTGLSMNPLTFLAPSNVSLWLLGATGSYPLLVEHRWWTLISASYLHGGILHILFNMIALNQLGPLVIREYGAARMFVIYTGAGIGGYLLSALAGVSLTIGASAAVCGLIGAALYYGKSRGGTYGQAVYRHVGGWVISLFIFGFLVPGINNWGHGGGIIAGLLLGLLLGYRERRPDTFAHQLLAGACALLTGLVLVWAVLSGVLTLMTAH